MNMRRIFATLGAGLLMSGALVTLTAQAANADTPYHPPVFNLFLPIHNVGSGKCLAPSGVSNGARIVQQTCDGSDWQKWQFLIAGCVDGPQDSTNCFVPYVWAKNKGTLKCMDLNNGSSVNGTPVQIWDCANSRNMWWDVDFGNPTNSFSRMINISAAFNCLDVAGGSVAENAPLQGYHCFDWPNNVAQSFIQG